MKDGEPRLSARVPPQGPHGFRALWDGAEDAMVLTDGGGTVLGANPAYCALHHIAFSELIGQSLAFIFPEADRLFALSRYRAVFRSLELDESRTMVVRWQESLERLVESRIDLLVERGQPTAMMSTVRVVMEERSDGKLSAMDSGEMVGSVADVLIEAIDKWGFNAVLGGAGDNGIRIEPGAGRPLPPSQAREGLVIEPERAARLDEWEDEGGATLTRQDRPYRPTADAEAAGSPLAADSELRVRLRQRLGDWPGHGGIRPLAS